MANPVLLDRNNVREIQLVAIQTGCKNNVRDIYNDITQCIYKYEHLLHRCTLENLEVGVFWLGITYLQFTYKIKFNHPRAPCTHTHILIHT